MHPQTSYRWFREGTLPVPAERVGPRTILVNVEANACQKPLVVSGCMRASHLMSNKDDLERQVARLTRWAANTGRLVVRVESEVASGMNGARTRATRLLADPAVTTVVVEHKDRLGRMDVELVEAAEHG